MFHDFCCCYLCLLIITSMLTNEKRVFTTTVYSTNICYYSKHSWNQGLVEGLSCVPFISMVTLGLGISPYSTFVGALVAISGRGRSSWILTWGSSDITCLPSIWRQSQVVDLHQCNWPSVGGLLWIYSVYHNRWCIGLHGMSEMFLNMA